MPSFAPRSAKNAKVRIAGNVLTAKEWTVEVDPGDVPTDNFEGGGFRDVETEFVGCTVTVVFDLDGNSNPYDAPLNLQPGTTISSSPTKLYLNDTTGPFWNFPSVKVMKGPQTAKTHEMLGSTLTFKSKGTFSYPTGSF